MVFQSRRGEAYENALAQLAAAGLLFGCRCSRREIEEAGRRAGLAPGVYPGTCRGHPVEPGGAIRVRVPEAPIRAGDRRLGPIVQSLARDVGDFVVRRADGLWAYQLAVVVDDAAAGITDIVRGEDLADNTPRQVFLQRALRLPTPRYLHLPLVLGDDGRKLSKQTGAAALDIDAPRTELARALAHLGLPDTDLGAAVAGWHARWTA